MDPNFFDDAFSGLAKLVSEIYQCETLENPYVSEVPDGLPRILSAVYVASLLPEEGKYFPIRVVCANSDFLRKNAGFGEYRDYDFEAYQKPIDLSPQNIRKLSAAVDSNSSAIAVDANRDSGLVLGIVRFRTDRRSLDPNSRSSMGFLKLLEIKTRSNGHLVLTDLTYDLCEFDNGSIRESFRLFEGESQFLKSVVANARNEFPVLQSDSRLDGYICYGDELEEKRRSDGFVRPYEHKMDYPQCVRMWASAYCMTLQMILHQMENHGCGGTLLLTDKPFGLDEVTDVGCMFGSTENVGSSELGFNVVKQCLIDYFAALLQCFDENLIQKSDDLLKWILASSELEDDAELRSRSLRSISTHAVRDSLESSRKLYQAYSDLESACRMVGRLTAADGATVLLRDLTVLSHSTKLKLDASYAEYAKVYDQYNADKPIEELPPYERKRGTRFASAISAAHSRPNSICFVASADGPITACLGIEDVVIVAEPMTISRRHENILRYIYKANEDQIGSYDGSTLVEL